MVGDYGLTIIVRVTHHKLETLSSIVREPECVVREPEWLFGVESESMTGVMGWSQSLWCKSQRL